MAEKKDTTPTRLRESALSCDLHTTVVTMNAESTETASVNRLIFSGVMAFGKNCSSSSPGAQLRARPTITAQASGNCAGRPSRYCNQVTASSQPPLGPRPKTQRRHLQPWDSCGLPKDQQESPQRGRYRE